MRFLRSILRFLVHLRFGILIASRAFVNEMRVWSEGSNHQAAQATSISDTDSYTSIVFKAATEAETYSRFRSNFHYRAILDHVSYEQGLSYLALLKASRKDLAPLLARLSSFNHVGSPHTYPIRLGGSTFDVSPTLLRYLKVAVDLENLFGDLSSMKIAEIGIGFGGQANVLTTGFDASVIELWDLPEVHGLASKFLQDCGGVEKVSFRDGRRPQSSQGDLVISNYAFSELSRPVQMSYLDGFVSTASRGYITWNLLSEKNLNGLTLDEFLNLMPNASVQAEVPLTAPGNCIVVWGQKPGASVLC